MRKVFVSECEMRKVVETMCLIAVVSLSGCNRGPELASVHGTLRYKGAPVPNATIAFNAAGKQPAITVTDSAGNYRVITPHVGEGISPGTYKITIRAIEDTGQAPKSMMDEVNVMPNPTKMRWLVPPLYADLAKTPLEREVQPGDNTIDYDLSK
jgi:hypothetical protein